MKTSNLEQAAPATYHSGGSDSPTAGRRGARLGQLFGIDIYLDASVIIIFSLVVAVLALSVFPSWHPDWNFWTSWMTALAAGLLFFASLLAHEFAHSLVARYYGLPVPRITLFLFGGVSEMEDEPESPKQEFTIAIVGPLTSLVLGLLFTNLGAFMAGADFATALMEDPASAVKYLNPVQTLLMWLGPINILLAIFNMLPGFPLDGGRVFRAIGWWTTGDRRKATRWSAGAGRILGWLILAVGALQLVEGAILGGLWLILIGWFLSSSAGLGYRRVLTSHALEGCSARHLMRTDFTIVSHDLPIPRFIEEHLMQSAQTLWPVTDSNDQLCGYVGLAEVRDLRADQRERLTVGDVANKHLDEVTVPPDRSAMKVLDQLAVRDLPFVVVDDNNRALGLLSQAEFMKWLALYRTD